MNISPRWPLGVEVAVIIPGRMIYLRTPHTASVATENAIVRNVPEAVQVLPGHAYLDEVIRDGCLTKDGRLVSSILDGERDEVVVTTVRNPYEMVFSWWIKSTAMRSSLVDFVTTCDDHHHLRDGRLFYRADESHVVLNMDTLDEDLSSLMRAIELPVFDIPVDNVTPKDGHHWREHMSGKVLLVMRDRFGDEIEDYGYEVL